MFISENFGEMRFLLTRFAMWTQEMGAWMNSTYAEVFCIQTYTVFFEVKKLFFLMYCVRKIFKLSRSGFLVFANRYISKGSAIYK
jgi:hypothetical protein